MSATCAAIDIGSNTVQMLLAQISDGRFISRRNYLATTRLGHGGDKLLSADAIAETAAIVADFVSQAREALRLRIIATSAVRDAQNSAELQSAITALAPQAPAMEILSGEAEARLSFLGARVSIDAPPDQPVIDMGGSSTEVIYELGGRLRAVSVDMGAVRAMSHGWDRQEIKERLSGGIRRLNNAAGAVGVGGTITAAAGVLRGLPEYDRAAIEGMALSYADLDKLLHDLLPLTVPQRCAFSPLLTKRGEIMEQGLYIWLSLMEILQTQTITVCGGGILDGAVAEIAGVKGCN